MKIAGLLLAGMLMASAAGDDNGPSPGGAGPLVIESALLTMIEEVEVPARVEGVLQIVETREGQHVEAGQFLAKVDDAEPRLTLERAKIELDIARKQAASSLRIQIARKAAEVARVELKRARESNEKYKKSVSETELDKLRLNTEKADLDIEQALHEQSLAELGVRLKEAERALAEQAVDRRRIASPLAGVVVQVNHHTGEWVEPGKTVLRILRIDPLRVEGFVSAKALTGDLAGQPARLTIDLPGHPGSEFTGRVSFVSPEVNPVNGQVRIWAEVENSQLRLRPGQKGRLTIGEPPAVGAR